MKVTPVSSPSQIVAATPNPQAEAQIKARAVAAFNAASQTPQAQETPVANPNNISTEELSAIQPTQTTETETQEATETSDNITVSTEATPESQEIREKAQVDPEVERRFAQIARQEKALRAKIQQANTQFKQREADLKAREAALSAPEQKTDLSNYISKDQLKRDALSALEEAGVSWDELTNQVINRQPTDPRVASTIQRLEAKIAQLEQEAQTGKQAQLEQQQQAYQAAVKQIRADVKQLVNSDPEFETVKAMNATKDVVELIEKTYAQEGVILSVEEAAREVENYLVDEALKVTQIGKIKQRLEKSRQKTAQAGTKQQETQQPQMKTLTNAASSQRPLTARERAIAAMEGRLK